MGHVEPWPSNYKETVVQPVCFNTLSPTQNCRNFEDDIFKCIFLNENVWIMLRISLKFVPKIPINNIPALVQIMAWSRPGDKPLSEPMMVSLLTHICDTQPQWVTVTWDACRVNLLIWHYCPRLVSILIADGLEYIWHQANCNHHDDRLSGYIGSVSM